MNSFCGICAKTLILANPLRSEIGKHLRVRFKPSLQIGENRDKIRAVHQNSCDY
jgi:hypothetical protein